MKTGKYVKTKEREAVHRRAVDIPVEERRHPQKKGKRKNQYVSLIVVLAVILLLLIALVFILSGFNSKSPNNRNHESLGKDILPAQSEQIPVAEDNPAEITASDEVVEEANPLLGIWDMDGVTSYEFVDEQTGKLLLPSSEYEFSYKTDGDVLTIDFADERARDAVYQFSVQGDTMALTGGTVTTQDSYTLTRRN